MSETKDILDYQENQSRKITDISDLILVHATNYIPENGVIKSPKDAGALETEKYGEHEFQVARERKTIHFCVNGAVTDHEYGTFESKYAIIIPLESIISKIAEGTLVDLYTAESIEIPEGSYIICSDKMELEGKVGNNLSIIECPKGTSVRDYANLFIFNLGYKVEGIGKQSWSSKEDNIIGSEILKKYNKRIIGHTNSRYRKLELGKEANNRLIGRAKIKIENDIDTSDAYFYQRGTDFGTDKYFDFRDEELVTDLYEKLKLIGIEIPKNTKKEIEEISNGNYENSEETVLKAKESLKEEKDVGPYLSDNPKIIAGEVLIRKILGEIELKKIQKKSTNKKDFFEILQLFNDKVFEYTSPERRKEFLAEQGIDISKMQQEVLNSKELSEMYVHIYGIKDIPFSQLSEEDKKLSREFLYNYRNSDKNHGDYRFVNHDVIKTENGENYLALINLSNDDLNLSPEEIEKLGNEYIGQGEIFSHAMLNLNLDIESQESVSEYCKRYEEYIDNVLSLLTQEKQKETVSTQELGKQTLEEQKDSIATKKMEDILNTRLIEFIKNRTNTQARGK